jgi:DNA-binding response OmpR family regulator
MGFSIGISFIGVVTVRLYKKIIRQRKMDKKYEILLSKSSVLLAEDDERVRMSFKMVLELYVDSVYCAKNGREAYDIYYKQHPDIVITDIKMPVMSGLELVGKIRQKDSEIPIIVTSAYTDQDFLMESIKLSLVEYLVKPVKESDLSRVLEGSAKKLYQEHHTLTVITDEISYDLENKFFVYNGEQIVITPKEVEFVELLLSHRGNLLTKQEIEDKIYIYEEAPISALKNLVFKLRKKLPVEIIESVGKLGYMIK